MTDEETLPLPSFEEAYVRLEKILEKMNFGNPTLQESLTLYEEADRLITSCNTRLLEAEQKIETLIKTREGTLALDEQNKPLTQSFS